MSRRSRTFITTMLAAIVFSTGLTTTVCAQERKKTFFQKFAEFLAPAPVPAPPAEAVAPMGRVVNPPNPANEAIKDERRDRLMRHMVAMQSWIDAVCSLTDEQKTALSAHLNKVVDDAQNAWLQKPNRGEQNGDRDFIPFEFIPVARKLTRSATLRRKLDELLTKEQAKKLAAAQKQRDDAIGNDLAGLAVVVLDRELFLVANQREPVAKELRSMLGSQIYPGLFGFYNNAWPFQRATFKSRKTLKDLLGPVRAKRFTRLTKQNGQAEQYVMITLGAGAEETAFGQAIDAQPERLAEAMATRIEFLKETHGLSQSQCRKLAIAAKGAASREIEKWVEQSEKQLDSMRDQFGNQNVSWGMSTLQVKKVEDNRLWINTRKRVLAGEKKKTIEEQAGADQEAETAEQVEQFKKQVAATLQGMLSGGKTKKEPRKLTERESFHRTAMVSYLVAIIDQEVWLRDDQRARMQELIDGVVADFGSYQEYSGSYTELQMLADVLYGVKQKPLKGLLAESQLEAWGLIKKQFSNAAGNGLITIKYRHGDVQFRLVAGRN